MEKCLLIHGIIGFLSDPGILAPFGQTQVLTPDLLGYGAYRNANTDDLTIEAQADHVANWLRQQTTEPVHLVGHSSGGAVAVLLAKRHPGLN